jgi:hypothetical protein
MADAAAELDEGGAVRTLKDLFAGAAGGIAQVLLGEIGVQFSFSCAIESTNIFIQVTCEQKWGSAAELKRWNILFVL